MTNLVHSGQEAVIPAQPALNIVAELQALALAIRLFGLDNLDKVVLGQPLSNPQQLEGE